MPSVGLFHEQYWNNNRHTNIVVVSAPKSAGGYPLWQSSVSVHSVAFAPPLDPLYRLWARLRWLWAMVRVLWSTPVADRDWTLTWASRLQRLSEADSAAFDHLWDLAQSPAWNAAVHAVEQTWTTPAFTTDFKLWKAITAKTAANAGESIRLYRHLDAVQHLNAQGVDVPLHDLHFLLEAAYVVFAARPKRTV